MEIRKLLFVTKFEELGFDSLRALLELRKASLEHIVFVNVIERERVAMRRGTGYRKDEEIRCAKPPISVYRLGRRPFRAGA